MAEKKILNVTFASYPTGAYKVNIGCNSSDNVPVTPPNVWNISDDYPLGQVGCAVAVPNSGRGLDTLEQTFLKKEMDYCGYGDRVAVLKSSSQIGVKMYLNGKPVDEDNNPQPYVVFEDTGYFCPQLIYYTADNTKIGEVYTNLYYGSENRNYAVALAGKIYTDGTCNCQRILVSPHYIAGIPSNKRYEWRCVGTMTTNEVINSNVIDDLQDYLPIPPEGEFMDPHIIIVCHIGIP